MIIPKRAFLQGIFLLGAIFASSSSALPLTPARLALPPGSGLTITGAVGTIYAIQCSTNLAQPSPWRGVALLKLPSSPYLVPGAAPVSSGSRFYRSVAMTQSNLVFIAAGTFTLGSPTNEADRYSDESPQTVVHFTQGLWMAPYLVTQQQYRSLTGTNPSAFTGDLSRPVEQVSWFDATNYCHFLTQQELAAGKIPAGFRYRLPTEAEWEYACRAGTTTRFNYGDDPGYLNLTNHAWYTDNSPEQTTHPIGQKLSNLWGLYDMHGNVWEWCQDWYDTYPGGSVTDPQGPSSGDLRVVRGGSWADESPLCRSACRIADDPSAQYFTYGFRIVLAPIPF
jgi:formylglycine-generating enzyme required for sulfatase activity